MELIGRTRHSRDFGLPFANRDRTKELHMSFAKVQRLITILPIPQGRHPTPIRYQKGLFWYFVPLLIKSGSIFSSCQSCCE